METTTRIVSGIEFSSNVIDVTKARAGDLLTIAYKAVKGNVQPDTNAIMAKAVKNVTTKVEVVKHPKYFELEGIINIQPK